MTDLEALPAYSHVLREHVAVAAGGNVEVEVHGLAPGTYGGLPPMEVLRYPLSFHQALLQVLDNVETSERRDFDAFLMGSFVAPFLREARSAVDIVVTSMVESVLLTARSFSRHVGLVCINDHQVSTSTDLIGLLGLDDFYMDARPIDLHATEDIVSASLKSDGSDLIDSFERTARELVANGADVIVPAEGILSEAVRLAGVGSVEGAPVVDSVQISIAHAATLAGLVAEGAVGIGRRRTFPKDPHTR